jgi:alkanesulfonate monooxygenase SsuD/methylene tetrahydromethanopterin reductase-like flavin-dependent oxidoreductase (luciferase family)
MKVGASVIFQNPFDRRPDYDIYREELALGDLAEPLGFDSLWSVEHHFDDYTMCPDVLQFLAYYAGRTRHIRLGSMVVVLPWHDPVRVAEQVSVVDHYSNGRMILGLGRGLARHEFEGFRVSLDESRERFVECATTVIEGLERGYVEFEGKYIRQPRRDIRPRPFRSFRGRTYAAAVSPESARIMARLGIGILIIPQKPWEAVARDLAEYRSIYENLNHAAPPSTIAAGWVFCDRDASRARDMAARYIGDYWHTALRHYEMTASDFGNARGYEFYREVSRSLAKSGADAATEYFLNLQVWGTPSQCIDRVVDIRERLRSDHFIGVFSYAGMPRDEAERNMRLFAAEVMPRLKQIEDFQTAVA